MKTWRPDRAKELIQKRGYTRAHVASKCGIEPASLQQNLQGRTPGGPLLILLAQLLQTNVEYLTGDSDDANPKEVA